MKRPLLPLAGFVLAALLCSAARAEVPTLARVSLAGRPETYPLPVQAMFQDSQGRDYLLVFAPGRKLDQAGWPWQALGQPEALEDILVATEMRPGARAAAQAAFWPWLDDGRRWILPATALQAEALQNAGFAIERLSSLPIDLKAGPDPRPRRHGGVRVAEDDPILSPHPLVAEMVRSVTTTNLWWLMRQLTGLDPVLAENGPHTLTNRNTSSEISSRKATAFAFDRFQAAGVQPAFQAWTNGGYIRRNVLATHPGTVRSNELVLLVAHLDDLPSGVGPGADDNASGSAAVLAAAGICARYSFDRTLRFILFTGEENGLWGSAASALASKNAGEQIVAVLNLDMIAWDDRGPPVFQLHTRATNHAAFSNDLAIASVFTNCVSVYGLSGELAAAIYPDALTASDHSSYWNRGYAAVIGIEEYGGDFNTNYHKSTDTLFRLNMRYMTAAVKAGLAATAHLAGPVQRWGADVVSLNASDMRSGSTNASRRWLARHLPGATETAPETFDWLLTAAPPLTNAFVLQSASEPYAVPLAVDARPTTSESDFRTDLSISGAPGSGLTTSNRLRLEFPSPPLPERLYNARIRVFGPCIGQPGDFVCVTNLRSLAIQAGGQLPLPDLVNVPAGSNYGTCEISTRFLDRSAERCRLDWAGVSGGQAVLEAEAQVGAALLDVIEVRNALDQPWTTLLTQTNRVEPDITSFDTGWTRVRFEVDLAGAAGFLRLKRTWLEEW